MNLRKYMLLVVGGGITLVLLVAATMLLMRYREKYVDVNQRMDTSLRALDRLRKRDPFPSHENVEQARQNKKELEKFRATLMADLQKGQTPIQDMEAAEFRQLLEVTLSGPKGLRLAGRGANVVLPDLFAFGFDRYVRGALPETEHIPRLVDQLNMVKRLCEILYDAQIAELQSITRDQFELEAEAGPEGDIPEIVTRSRRRRGPAPAPEPKVKKPEKASKARELFTRERISLTFLAREKALWTVLNELARNERFMAVTNVEFLSGDGPAARPTGPPGAAPRPETMGADGPGFGVAEAAPLGHDERVVAGQERIQVRLSVEIYRFGTPESAEANKEATP
jgi:hypothetical protein